MGMHVTVADSHPHHKLIIELKKLQKHCQMLLEEIRDLLARPNLLLWILASVWHIVCAPANSWPNPSLSPVTDEFDAYIIVSFVNATLVLSIGETVEEVTDSGFLGTTPTLSCSQLGDDALVQVNKALSRGDAQWVFFCLFHLSHADVVRCHFPWCHSPCFTFTPFSCLPHPSLSFPISSHASPNSVVVLTIH